MTSLANLTLAAPCHKARTLRRFFTVFDVFGLSTARKPRNVSCIMILHGVEVNPAWLFLTGRFKTGETACPLRLLAETLAIRSILQSRVTVQFGPAVTTDFFLHFFFFFSCSTGFCGKFVCRTVGAAMFDVSSLTLFTGAALKRRTTKSDKNISLEKRRSPRKFARFVLSY